MRYLLSVNRSHRGKLPKDATPGQWATFNDAFETVELTSSEIAAEIRAGHAIAAVHDGRRKRSNWQLCQHIGLDLDDGSMSWDDVVNHPLVEACASIVHTTASHRPDAPRMRVLFLLEEPIEDADSYASIVACFLRAFSTADPLCKDPSRLFFGAPDCSLLHMPDNRLTEEDIANIATAWPPLEDDAPAPRSIGFKVPPNSGATSPLKKEPPAAGDIVPPAELSPTRKAAHLAALLDKIRYAPDGKKWGTLRDVSITMGGYARAGYLSPDEARTMLQGAIEARRATVASMPAAYATIEDGLAYGALRPLYYERGDNPRHDVRADADARRQDLRAQLIADRIAELERAIADAPNDAPDFADMVEEYAHLKTAAVAA